MRLSLKALKRFVDVDFSPRDLAECLSHLGFPTDAIVDSSEGLEEVRLGQIKEKKGHPDADRLSLLQVEFGEGQKQIVCGAQNMSQGDYVAVAPVGSKIPGPDGSGIKLKKSKIRGEVSEGMCCSLAELQLAEEADGIWLIDSAEAKKHNLGTPIIDVVGLRDTIIEVDITPNRGDAACIRGLAREVAAKINQRMSAQTSSRFNTNLESVAPEIESFEDCFGFATCLVSSVKTGPSPSEWQQFLSAMGGRSIFNLVDISNIVLFEFGHPIHFFDADKIDPKSLVARRAKAGEKLKLLDGTEIELHPEDLVIADSSGPLSLAGIMGGERSSVDESTKNVLIEVASFNPKRIRASAQRHQLSSESSFRFERGVNPYRIDETMERALGLLQEVSGFDSASGGKLWDKQKKQPSCLWSREKVEKKIGRLKLSDDEIFSLLRRLEYKFEGREGATQVIFPWYRSDGECLEDVMEDIARLIGYENLEVKSLRAYESLESKAEFRELEAVGQALVDSFTSKSFVEAVHLSFFDPEFEEKFGLEAKPVELVNPIHAERSILRRSLVPQLVERGIYNFDRSETEIRFVELGPVYHRESESQFSDSPVGEEMRIGCLWMPRAIDEKRMWQSKTDYFYQFKGLVEAALRSFESLECDLSNFGSFLHPNRQLSFKNGIAGELHPKLAEELGLKQRCFAGEWRVSGFTPKKINYVNMSEYPAIDLDLSLLVDESVRVGELERQLQKLGPKSLVWARAYDIYRSKELGSKKSCTFSLRYQAPDRTLSTEEAQKAQEKLLSKLVAYFEDGQVALR